MGHYDRTIVLNSDSDGDVEVSLIQRGIDMTFVHQSIEGPTV